MIRYIAFCKTVDLSSFTRAADVLGYTQAAVSQMIRSLEDECGVPLILRLRTGIQLTRAGEMLYPYVRQLVDDNKCLTEKIREIRSLETGELRIGALYGISETYIPSLISKYTSEFPDASISLVSKNTDGLEGRLNLHDIDIAIVNTDELKGAEFKLLAVEPYYAFIPKSHPLAARKSITREELSSQTLIIPSKVEDSLIENTLDLSNTSVYRITAYPTIIHLASEGLGIAVLPVSCAKNVSTAVNAVPITPTISRNIGIAYHNREWLTAAAQKFLTIALEHFPREITL